MKFSALICTPLAPGLLAYLTGDLFHRGILPELFLSEKLGAGTLRIRLELECTPEVMEALQVYWKTCLKAQAVVVTASEESRQPAVLLGHLTPAPKAGPTAS